MRRVAVERAARRSAADHEVEDGSGVTAASNAPDSFGRWSWEWIKSLLIATALFLVMRTFLIEPFRIPTASMENTLLAGDFLLVNKAAFGSRVPVIGLRIPAYDRPARGDVLVFVPPHDPRLNYVKRLIALPRDTVEMMDKRIHVNGEPVIEPYARYTDSWDTHSPRMHWQCEYRSGAARAPCRPMRDNWGPLIVPEDRFMVLGDNRDNSEDSRYWGFVARDDIRGRPLLVYYSFDPESQRPLPWLTRIRWSRIGEMIH